MKSAFRAFLLLAFIVTTLPHSRSADTVAPEGMPPFESYFRCDKEQADVSLEIVTKLDGIFAEKKEKIYYRSPTSADGDSMPQVTFSRSVHADGVSKNGKGIGYGYSIDVTQEKNGVEMVMRTSWTLDHEHGSSILEVAVPYLSDRAGCAAGYTYSCVCTKIR